MQLRAEVRLLFVYYTLCIIVKFILTNFHSYASPYSQVVFQTCLTNNYTENSSILKEIIYLLGLTVYILQSKTIQK